MDQTEDLKNSASELKPDNKIVDYQAAYQQAIADLQDYKDRYLRALAETQNLEKTLQKDMANTRDYSLQSFILALLPAVDSLEYAIKQHKEHNIAYGLQLILDMISDTFASFGVSAIYPGLGDAFLPAKHDVIKTACKHSLPSGVILEVLQRGYLLKDRVIRPARVIVNDDSIQQENLEI